MARIPQQLVPVSIVAALLLATFVIARQIFVPETFGELGHYRAAAIGEIAAQPAVYAGFAVCLDCHEEVYAHKQTSSHAGLACEACHGPAAAHTEAPDEALPHVPRAREHCELCHAYNAARPSGFPQILADRHNPGDPCIACHDAHAPRMPITEGDCSACHGEIANQKAVSKHARLECTQCHEVPAEHFTNPRTVVAARPQSRAVCGACHDRGADSSREIPRIDLETHGGRYNCWDCHYPHLPEA